MGVLGTVFHFGGMGKTPNMVIEATDKAAAKTK